MNRKLTETATGINYQYQYDTLSGAPSGSYNIGRLVSATNSVNANEQFSYDPMGRLKWQASWTPQNPNDTSIITGATYDLAGNLITLNYPDGRSMSQVYDGAAHMSTVTYAKWGDATTNQPYFTATEPGGYDPAGHLVSATIGASLPYNASYDNRERIQGLAYGPPATSSTTPLWSKQYGWTVNNNLQAITDQITGVQRQFSYDNIDRLMSAQDIYGSTSGSGGSGGGSGGSGTGTTTGASGAVPWFTNPDDSNTLSNIDEPNANWGIQLVTVAVNSAVAPDGSQTATSLTATGGSTDSFVDGFVSSPYLYNGETMNGSVWLKGTTNGQTINVYMVDVGTSGWAVAGWKQVTLTTSWQQVQISATVQNGLTALVWQIGGGGSFTSGQVFMWNPMVEDEGSAGASVTNFLPYSQRTTAATWSVNAGGATDNTVIAPDGTNTGATLASNSTSADTWAVDNMPNPAPYSGIPVTGSVWLKSPSGSQQILITLIEVGASGYQTLGYQTVTLSSNWQRFQMTGVTQNNLSGLQLQIGGAGTFTGGQSVNVWGAQMELASTAGPYVATGGSPKTMGTGLTNLLPYSQQLNGPSWNPVAGTVSVNTDTAPDGTHTAATFNGANWGSSNQYQGYLTTNVANPSLYDGQTVTVSVFLRSPSGAPLSTNLWLVQNGSTGFSATPTEAVTLTGQWQRFALTGTLETGLTSLYFQFGNASSGQVIEVWGAQMELASHAGPYVPTTALPVLAGEQLTNILPNSQQLNGPSWGAGNGTMSANTTTVSAPDSTTTAAMLTATTGSTDTYAVDSVPNPSLYDGQTMTASVYLRVPSGTLATNLYLVSVGDQGWGIAGQQMGITLTTSWQRFQVTGTVQNGLTNMYLQIGGGGTITSGESLDIWGPQLVPGTDPAPYISPGTGGTVTNYVTAQPGTLVTNGLNQVYSYDSFGNIQQNGGFNDGYTAQNQMAGYSYDASGNLLADGLFNLYTWDAESQLVSNGSATYIYDAMGQRVEKQGMGVTDTIYFGGKPIARLMGGQWTDLIYGPTGMLAEVAGTQTATPAFRLLDHLGNEVGTLGSNGLLANPLDYTPFGQIFSGTTNDPYLFTGKERDAESGNDYFGARYFTSTVGRFLSPDWSAKADPVPYTKLDDPQSLNLYAYVHNNPLSGVDADGHGYEGASGHEYYRGPGSDENWRQNANGVFANEKKTATDKQAKQNKLGYDTIDTSQTPRPNVAISWKLKNKSASGGWVVQHITKMNGGKETSNFWEAWQVNPGQNHTIYHPNHFPLNIDDLFANNPSGTHVDATARFYEGLSLPDSFIPGNPATSAGELRSTTQDPHLSLDSATNEVHRTWDAH